jgi:amino acid permease
MLTNNLENVLVCYVIFYIVDILGSFIGCKLDNKKNNKNVEGWDCRKNNLIQTILRILQWQILIILNSMLICNPIQNFEGGGGVQV